MAPTFTFCPVERRVFWGTLRMQPALVEALLDFYHEHHEVALFLELQDARDGLAAPGSIIELKPLNITVRALDPAIWAAVPSCVEAA